ncbi:MAG: HpcH/HpaI aldolase family protein [Acetobacteraceae bacterium]
MDRERKDHERLPIANRAKERLAAGELVLCLGTRQARTPDIAMIADASGFDAFYIDMEHSTITLEAAAAIASAALGIGITPIVRVAGQAAHDAARLLDGGALGIIYPHVATREEALAFVAACKFPPAGHRSVAGSGPAQLYRRLPLAEVNRLGNEITLAIAMIEDPEGVAHADAIAAVPGLDMLLIGSNDLCTEFGIPGQLHHPKLKEAYAAVGRACAASGKVLGIGGIRGDPELTRELLALGARFMIAGSDVGYLMKAAAEDVRTIRALEATTRS